MWFILLFAACTTALPIVLEVHYKGSDNILTRSGEEIRRSRLMTGPLHVLAGVRSLTMSLAMLAFLGIALIGLLNLLAMIGRWLL
jgi:hypothetical protein